MRGVGSARGKVQRELDSLPVVPYLHLYYVAIIMQLLRGMLQGLKGCLAGSLGPFLTIDG